MCSFESAILIAILVLLRSSTGLLLKHTVKGGLGIEATIISDGVHGIFCSVFIRKHFLSMLRAIGINVFFVLFIIRQLYGKQ